MPPMPAGERRIGATLCSAAPLALRISRSNWALLRSVPLFMVPATCTVLGPHVVPPIGRVAGPVVCPAGYARSYVRTWVSSDGAGKTGDHWELVCVLSAVE